MSWTMLIFLTFKVSGGVQQPFVGRKHFDDFIFNNYVFTLMIRYDIHIVTSSYFGAGKTPTYFPLAGLFIGNIV